MWIGKGILDLPSLEDVTLEETGWVVLGHVRMYLLVLRGPNHLSKHRPTPDRSYYTPLPS